MGNLMCFRTIYCSVRFQVLDTLRLSFQGYTGGKEVSLKLFLLIGFFIMGFLFCLNWIEENI